MTLTYRKEDLPGGYCEGCANAGLAVNSHAPGSLCPTAPVLFMKRLRERLGDVRVRSFGCAEYGSQFSRPHYHLCLFGYDFSKDRVFLKTSGSGLPIFRSPLLEEVWPFGFSSIGTLTFESGAYVARYICKKHLGKLADLAYVLPSGELLEPERTVCVSRRPGIGKDWISLYHSETYRDDSVVIRERSMRPPKYYDRVFSMEFPAFFKYVSRKRKRRLAERPVEHFSRLAVRERHADLKFVHFNQRGYEHEDV